MNKFVITHKIELSDVAESWKDCYIEVNDLTMGDIQDTFAIIGKAKDGSKEQIDAICNLIENLFLSGKGWDGTKIIDIMKEDVKELPLSIIMKVFGFLVKPQLGSTITTDIKE